MVEVDWVDRIAPGLPEASSREYSAGGLSLRAVESCFRCDAYGRIPPSSKVPFSTCPAPKAHDRSLDLVETTPADPPVQVLLGQVELPRWSQAVNEHLGYPHRTSRRRHRADWTPSPWDKGRTLPQASF